MKPLRIPFKVLQAKEDNNGTYLYLKLESNMLQYITEYNKGSGITGELRIDDGRAITADQRKKIFATIADISIYTGYEPEYLRQLITYWFCCVSGEDYFSLSSCSLQIARELITFIIDFALEHGVQLSDLGINRTDDIDKYLWLCLKHKKCAVCGRTGEIHHVDTIGMGANRNTVDDSNYRKICLCRVHHSEAHNIGVKSFSGKYHVYGVVYNE